MIQFENKINRKMRKTKRFLLVRDHPVLKKKSSNRKRKNEVFLIFDVVLKVNYTKVLKECQYKENGHMIKIENISIKDLAKLWDMIAKVPKISNLFNIPLIKKNSKQFQLYMDSHDRLITNLYKKELIMLPIRLGTVDFHKMCLPNEDKLSEITNDSIMQSYFVVT